MNKLCSHVAYLEIPCQPLAGLCLLSLRQRTSPKRGGCAISMRHTYICIPSLQCTAALYIVSMLFCCGEPLSHALYRSPRSRYMRIYLAPVRSVPRAHTVRVNATPAGYREISILQWPENTHPYMASAARLVTRVCLLKWIIPHFSSRVTCLTWVLVREEGSVVLSHRP